MTHHPRFFWRGRQYLDMILKAWGDWPLFQQLLSVLRAIGDRHGGVSIANVAMRWVLDHPCVGAVIIGQYHPTFFPILHALFWRPLVIFDPILAYLSPLLSIDTHNTKSRHSLRRTGARVGLSEHTDDNRRVFSFRLTKEDNTDIDVVLEQSNGRRLITSIGDCGAEYR